jgi:hypothetical protein
LNPARYMSRSIDPHDRWWRGTSPEVSVRFLFFPDSLNNKEKGTKILPR